MIRHLIVILCAVFFIADLSGAAGDKPADEPVLIGDPTPAGNPIEPGPEINSTGLKSAAGTVERLSLSQLIHQVVAQNHQIQIQRFWWDIRQVEEAGIHAIFEPEFVASVLYEDNVHKNSVEEALNRQGAIIYGERNWDYTLGVEGLVPTGGKVSFDYTFRQLSNTLTKSLTNEGDEYQLFFDISLRQPLLKNAGIETTRSAINIAEKKSHAAFQEYRQEIMQTVKKAAFAYWEFYQAQENLTLRKDSVRIAEKILVDNRERHKKGKMAETEVLEAVAALDSRKALLIKAHHQHHDAENRLRTLLSVAPDKQAVTLKATEKPVEKSFHIDTDIIVQKAFTLRPEYLAARKSLEESEIKLFFAQNQRRPELDLIASYGLNGLDFANSDAWEQIEEADFESWSLGLEFRMPIGMGIESKNKLKKAQLEKKQRLLFLKNIEVTVMNTIDTASHRVFSAAEQYGLTDGIVDIQKKLLDAELARRDAGKSDTRLILEKEDNYRSAKEMALKNKVELQMALMALDYAAGTVLLNHGLEIMEIKQ
jgi:outer membrane protein TolC